VHKAAIQADTDCTAAEVFSKIINTCNNRWPHMKILGWARSQSWIALEIAGPMGSRKGSRVLPLGVPGCATFAVTRHGVVRGERERHPLSVTIGLPTAFLRAPPAFAPGVSLDPSQRSRCTQVATRWLPGQVATRWPPAYVARVGAGTSDSPGADPCKSELQKHNSWYEREASVLSSARQPWGIFQKSTTSAPHCLYGMSTQRTDHA